MGFRGGAGRCSTPAEATKADALSVAVAVAISVAVADGGPDVWV
jgi:hypothetical protein